MIHRRRAAFDDLEVAFGVETVDLESTRRQDAHLLNFLFAVLAIGQDYFFEQAKLHQLLSAINQLGTPAEDFAWGIGHPIRAPKFASRRRINQDADMPVAHHLPARFIGPDVEVVALQVNVEKLLAHDVGNIVQADRLAGQHARKHPFEALVVRRADGPRESVVVALVKLSRLLRQIPTMAAAQFVSATNQVFNQNPVRLLVAPSSVGIVDLGDARG